MNIIFMVITSLFITNVLCVGSMVLNSVIVGIKEHSFDAAMNRYNEFGEMLLEILDENKSEK